MFDNNDIKKPLKAVGHDKVLIIGIDVSKYFHVVLSRTFQFFPSQMVYFFPSRGLLFY